jgi:hypothetical protein
MLYEQERLAGPMEGGVGGRAKVLSHSGLSILVSFTTYRARND